MQSVARAVAGRVWGQGHAGARSISTAKPRLAAELGAREKELLHADPDLSQFHSTKGTVHRIKQLGNILVIVIVAGTVFEISYKFQQRSTARAEKAQAANSEA